MSVFLSLIIALVVMLIQVFLQTTPAVFAIFYHNAIANKSLKRADDLALDFIFGVEFFALTIIVVFYLFLSFLILDAAGFLFQTLPFLLSLICFALAVFSLCFYFQRGKRRLALFFSETTASNLLLAAKKVKTRSDAMMLGIGAAATEIIFSLPLLFILTLVTLSLEPMPRLSLIIADIVIIVAPLFTIRMAYKHHHNLAEITRYRAKNRLRTKICLASLYLTLAILLIYVGVVANV